MLLYIMCQKEMDRKSIDALKGIGMLGILLVHYGLRTADDFVGRVVFWGARGAQLMLIINAFLIFTSLSNIDFNRKNIVMWWKKKFIRLIPLYYFFTVLYLIIFGTGPNYYLGTLPKISCINILCNLVFFHGFVPYYTNSININWFVGVLAIFYVLAPFLYKTINSLEKSVIAILIITPIGYIVNNILAKIHILEVHNIWLDYINIMSFLAEFPVILIGVFSYFVYQTMCKNVKNKRMTGLSMLFFASICLVMLFMRKDSFFIFSDIFSAGILLMLIFLSQLLYPVFLVKNKLFQCIGRHSYGIYLSHLIILKYINLFLGELRNDRIIIDILGYFLLVIISCTSSILAEKIVEGNFFKFLGRINKNDK